MCWRRRSSVRYAPPGADTRTATPTCPTTSSPPPRRLTRSKCDDTGMAAGSTTPCRCAASIGGQRKLRPGSATRVGARYRASTLRRASTPSTRCDTRARCTTGIRRWSVHRGTHSGGQRPATPTTSLYICADRRADNTSNGGGGAAHVTGSVQRPTTRRRRLQRAIVNANPSFALLAKGSGAARGSMHRPWICSRPSGRADLPSTSAQIDDAHAGKRWRQALDR